MKACVLFGCFIFLNDQSLKMWIPQFVIPGIHFSVMTIRIKLSIEDLYSLL